MLCAVRLFSAMLVTYINYNIIILYEWDPYTFVSMDDAVGRTTRHCNGNGENATQSSGSIIISSLDDFILSCFSPKKNPP